jgi:glycosyltransferase involved in cell wall biosynthesis
MDGRTVIDWRGRVDGYSGLAVEARGMIACLRGAGYKVQGITTPAVPEASELPSAKSIVGNGIKRSRRQTVPALTIVHLPWHDKGWDNLHRPVVWRAMFETASVPPAWSRRLDEVDEVWVPSKFNATTFAAAGVSRSKLRVIPEVIDRHWFQTRAATPDPNGTFRFLSVFRWQERKGWDLLLRAYLQEFNRNDDVELVIRADPFGPATPDIAETIAQTVKTVRPFHTPVVTFLPNTLPPGQLRRLYTRSHAFVLPTRGEACGRPFMEAMACGLITIGTGWGGHLDFMNSSNSLLVKSELKDVSPEAVREWPYYQNQRWAEPSLPDLRRCMRRAVNGGPSITEIRRRAAATIKELHSPDRLTEAFLPEVRRIIRQSRPVEPTESAAGSADVPIWQI